MRVKIKHLPFCDRNGLHSKKNPTRVQTKLFAVNKLLYSIALIHKFVQHVCYVQYHMSLFYKYRIYLYEFIMPSVNKS